MSSRQQVLKEILSDEELMKKYNITEEDLEKIQPYHPGADKIINILARIIDENDNKRTSRQIYNIIKTIHKI